MAFIKDGKAMIVDIFNGVSKKNNEPFRVAKMLFSGTGAVISAFVSNDAPALPPCNQHFACELPININRDGGFAPVINKDARFAKAE